MGAFWKAASDIVWGPFTVVLLLGSGIYLSFRLGWSHLRNFRLAWRFALQGISEVEPQDSAPPGTQSDAPSPTDTPPPGDISPFQSLMTMLAGAIGNGNIAGIANAIAVGGPGAVFWMWLSGVFAMATKYSEAILGFQYRKQMKDGTMGGGPMYYLRDGVKSPVLAWIFAFLAGIAAMTTGPLAQTNSMALVLDTEFHIPKQLSGLVIAIGVWLVVIGGIKSIARFAEKLVPLKLFLYVGGSLYVILTNIHLLPQTIRLIFFHAFTPTAAIGGFAGAGMILAARLGAARGLYANEAGFGTAGMAYGCAKSRNPVRQGLIASVDVFIITFVTCTMTALVVTITGKWSSGLLSTALVAESFKTRIPAVGGWIVAISSFLFGYSNLVGWSYYGELCFRFIFGTRSVKMYRWIYCGLIFFGAVSAVRTVWDYADTMNGLQIFPNLFALIVLAPQIVAITQKFLKPSHPQIR